MNERIKELAIKSGIAYLSEHTAYLQANDGFTVLPSVSSLEKFAGLVVAECMEVFSKDLPEPGDGKMLEVINRVCNVAEHFGVEE
jgi:hypothetical protein